jgi:hypothetical protein
MKPSKKKLIAIANETGMGKKNYLFQLRHDTHYPNNNMSPTLVLEFVWKIIRNISN